MNVYRWACDRRHENSVRSPKESGVVWAKCSTCVDGVTWRIELDVAEDNPAQMLVST